MMMEKHERNRTLGSSDENLIVLDSYDGAEHSQTPKKRLNIVSYNSQICSSSTIKNGCATTASYNILTWQQVIGDENCKTIFPVVGDVYNTKRELIKGSSASLFPSRHISFYDMHDGKMIYLLTQHSLWNRKFYPFLLCTCTRGDGVKHIDHQCSMLSHSDQCKYYKRSETRWNRKVKRDDAYNTKKHMNWIDESNFGVSHFGIHPECLRRENI